jgi:hypothetical protein
MLYLMSVLHTSFIIMQNSGDTPIQYYISISLLSKICYSAICGSK